MADNAAEAIVEKLTISWVRHAESFSNILEGNITDFYDFMEETGGKRPLTNLNNKTWEQKGEKTKEVLEEEFKDMIAGMKTFEINENFKIEEESYYGKIQNAIRNYKENSKYYKLYQNNDIAKLCEEGKKDDAEEKKKKNEEFKSIQMEVCKMHEDINKFDLDQWTWHGYNRDSIKSFYKKNWSDEPNSDIKPPCTWLFTPTLTFNGVRQALKLGEEYFSNKNEPIYDFASPVNDDEPAGDDKGTQVGGGIESYDAMICSASVRTIMTALFSILNSFSKDDNVETITNFFPTKEEENKDKKYKKLYIVPYINEKYNGSGEFDNANKTIPIAILDTVIHAIIDFVIEVITNKYDGLVINNENLKVLTNEMLKNFIDTSYYENLKNVEKLDPTEYSEGDYEKFTEKFLHKFLTDMNMTNTPHILAFSHGKNIDEDIKKELIEEYLSKVFPDEKIFNKENKKSVKSFFFPNNCSVWKVDYKKKVNTYSIDYDAYTTPSNLEDINPKIKGVIDIINGLNEIYKKSKGVYFTRDTKINENVNYVRDKIESVGYPFPSYLGAFARRTATDLENENSNFVDNKDNQTHDNYWCSLEKNKLRGKIVFDYFNSKQIKPQITEPTSESNNINNYDTSITWVRHGESIAQMIEAANDDAPLDKDKESFQKNVVNEIRKKELKSYERFIKQLETAYLESKVYSKLPYIIDQDTKNMVLGVNDKQLTTFLNSKYAKYTPASWFFTPTLTYVGVEEAKQFGKTFWYKNSDNYDLIISSPTVRTIMTALYASYAKHLMDKNPAMQIVIMPQINEEYAPTPYLDHANAAIPYEIIKEVIQIIKDFIKEDYKDIDIQIDTDFYIKKAKENANNLDDFYNGNFKEAQKYIQEYLKTLKNPSSKANILAFVHATFIKERLTEANPVQFTNLGEKYFPHNCSAYQLYYKLQTETRYNRFTIKYNNEQADFRNKKNKYKLEAEIKDDKYWTLNKDSLRGAINDLWIGQCYDDTGKNSCSMVYKYIDKINNKKGGKTFKSKTKTKRRPQRKTTLKRSRKINNKNKNKKTKNKKRTIQKRNHKRKHNKKTKHN